MSEMRKALAATLTGSAAALSYPGSVLAASFDNLHAPVSAVFSNLIGRPQNEKQEWTSSAPLTTYADHGKRPGAEVGHPSCDADHINFITAGRNVG